MIPSPLDRRDLLHILPTAFWALALLPACAFAHRRLQLGPEHVVWFVLLGAYCFPVAALLGILDRLPETLASFRVDRARFALAAAACILLVALNEIQIGMILAANAFVLMEFLHSHPRGRAEKLLAMILPAGYFLLGFTLVMLWNDVIASFRYFASADGFAASVDRFLLAGYSVPRFSAWWSRYPSALAFLEYVYFFMFNVMGAVLVLLAIDGGLGRALRAVGIILLAYTASLACYMIWPAHGPYFGDPHHFEVFPRTLASYGIQLRMLEQGELLWNHADMLPIRGNYFIGFPCMHIVQPLIAVHFMRHRPRLCRFLIAYTLILVIAILALDWHYLVDVIGGVPLAWLALRALGEHPFRAAGRLPVHIAS